MGAQFLRSQDSASINMTIGRGGVSPKQNQMKERTMNKICKKLVGVAILGSLVGMIPTAGFTAPVPSDAERSACTSDAFRL